MNTIKVSSVILNSIEGEIETNICKMLNYIKRASKFGAEVICFPELCITGYSTITNLDEIAITLNDSVFTTLKEKAETYKITILAGFAEKKNDCFFASHASIFPSGKIEVYRKLHLAPPEKNIFTMGNEIPVFKTKNLTYGIQLCYDAHFPRLSEAMAKKGIDLLLIPHASPRGTSKEKFDSWMRHLPARAYDNAIYVVVCNQVGRNKSGLEFPGITLSIDPSGCLVGKKFSNSGAMMITEISFEKIKSVREHKMRYFLPNSRNDIYE